MHPFYFGNTSDTNPEFGLEEKFDKECLSIMYPMIAEALQPSNLDRSNQSK